MERVLVTIEEAAGALGIGRSTVYKLMNAGELVQAKIGRRSLLTAVSIRAYAARVSDSAAASGGDR